LAVEGKYTKKITCKKVITNVCHARSNFNDLREVTTMWKEGCWKNLWNRIRVRGKGRKEGDKGTKETKEMIEGYVG
jgi:hypothetical protein